MERWAADFDPLAALEAEYAAVLAQSSISARVSSTARPSSSQDDDDKHEREHEDEHERDPDDAESDDDESGYAPLPSSPMGSDNGLFGSDAEEEQEAEAPPAKEPVKVSSLPPAPMDDRVKQEIMASMQRLRLPTPPWAVGADALSDQELVDLVQRRLRLSSAAMQGLPAHEGGDHDDANRPLAANVA
ncbi:hypothetical protein P43SY_001686 [Pythium insidiosum]|uniref:Uncharacterized protein n=1 Tax=Pythium insidiosum TaxID=114742 RepID=A0AAD5LJ59_PYTIN|nr:hypothetical protein P43SY_001686 [Pythium insidiosum]